MKAILLLCLISLLNCKFLDVALCLYKNDKLRSIATEVVDSFKTNNFNAFVEILLSNLDNVKTIAQKCFVKKTNLQNEAEEPTLLAAEVESTREILEDVMVEAADWKDVLACRALCGRKDHECKMKCLDAIS